ncbi:MAG: hypothetical protein ACTSVW_00305 [Candidatus Njordarchaeales archaeon]
MSEDSGPRKIMSIEEVDKVLHIGNPPSGVPAYIVYFLTLAILVVGFYRLALLIGGNWGAIQFILSMFGGTVVPYANIILTFILVIFALAILGAFIFLVLIRKTAKHFLYFIMLMFPILSIGFGVLLFVLIQDVTYGLVFVGLGVLGLLFFFLVRRKIELAGELLQLSAKAVLDEKGALLATSLSVIISSIVAIATLLTGLYVVELVTGYISNEWLPVVFLAVMFLGSWGSGFIVYLFDGAIIGIIHDWYRSPEVDVASFGRGLKRALDVKGGIATFALLMATLRLLTEQAKKGREKSFIGALIAFIAGVAYELVRFLTYYTLPAMVIRKTNFTEGIKDSMNKLKDLFVETLISYFGFGKVLALLGFIVMIFYAGSGYLVGAYLLYPILAADFVGLTPVAIGVTSALGTLLIGLIPTILIFRTVSIAFNGILYEFGLDLEFANKGITLPSRLPDKIKQDFLTILEEKGATIRI